MKLILTIAWRNILRHKGKSIVIGAILLVGSLIMTIGNGVIAGMDRGIERNIVNGFLGDIVIISGKQRSDNVLLEMMGASVEPINNYKQIKEVLSSLTYIDRFLPAGKNLAMALSSTGANPGFAYLLGVDFKEYRKMFPDSLTVVEGRFLQNDERGILVPTAARDEFYNYTNTWIIPEGGKLIEKNLSKDAKEKIDSISISTNVVLFGMNEANTSTDIRFNVKGIVKYRSLNTIFGHFSIADIESYRECLGYLSAQDKAVELPKEEKHLLGMGKGDLDSMFSEDTMMVSNKRTAPRIDAKEKHRAKEDAITNDVESGAYNIILVKLKPGVLRFRALNELNDTLTASKTGVRAIPWQKAAGPVGSMTVIIKGALFVFVTLLFVVAIIIIVNTLTMAALERTSELGMMRAIGARKSFIGAMFVGETAILSGICGGAGIIFGIIIINVIPLLNITTANDMLQLLYGGDSFRPVLKAPDIVLTLFQLLVVTILASLYPSKVARGITPLDAVTRD